MNSAQARSKSIQKGIVQKINNSVWSRGQSGPSKKQGGNTSGVDVSYGATFTYGDIIGVAIDLDSGTKTLTFYKNGVSQGVAFNPDVSLGAWFPAVSSGSSVKFICQVQRRNAQ